MVPQKKLMETLDQIFLLLGKKSYNEAERLCDNLISKRGEKTVLLDIKATILLQKGKHTEAKKIIDRLMRRKTSSSLRRVTLLTKVEYLVYKNQLKRAIKICDEVLKGDPKSHTALEYKGIALMRQRRYKEALKFLQGALGISSKCKSCVGNLALCHHKLGNLEQAKRYFNRVLKLDSKDLTAVRKLFTIYYNAGNFKRALHYVNLAISLDKADFVGPGFKGDTLMKLNRKKEAVPHYKRALFLCKKAHRKNASCECVKHCHIDLLRALIATKNFAAAKRFFRETTRKYPGDRTLKKLEREIGRGDGRKKKGR